MTFTEGQKVLDPLNRVVTVVEVGLEFVTVKLEGVYAARVRYSPSSLREIPKGHAVDCTGKVVKAVWGLCVYCDKPLTRRSLDDAHEKCYRAERDR